MAYRHGNLRHGHVNVLSFMCTQSICRDSEEIHRPSFVPSTQYASHPVLILLEGNLQVDLLNGGLDGSEANCKLTLELSVRGSVVFSKYWGA
jgi:hypothetical protein